MTNNRFTDILNSDTDRLDNQRAPVRAVFTSHRVALAQSRVLQTGMLDKLAEWRSEDTPVTGASARPCLISDQAILVGLLLLASEHRPLRISSLAEMFQNRLTSESRALLNLSDVRPAFAGDTREEKRWYSGTRRAFHRMLALMDPFPQERNTGSTFTEVQTVLDAHDIDRQKMMKSRLDKFTEGFLHMTFMQQPRRLRTSTSRIDVAVDQMFIASPNSRGFSGEIPAKKVANEMGADPRLLPRGPVDVFAGW